ncbi:MAG: DUF11 domain-containing protein [Lewinellaceae bacterium]|nr:DUF11 domain-containing protein [Lewinellaceae bacterium]
MKNRLSTIFKPWPAVILFAILLVGFSGQVKAQCNNDLTPPVLTCINGLTIDVLFNGTATVLGSDFIFSATDNCTPSNEISFFLEEAPASSSVPSTNSLNFSGSQTGTYNVVVWAVDSSGNADYCTTSLEIIQCFASAACNDQISVQLDANNSGTLVPEDGLEGSYCSFHDFEIQLDNGPSLPEITLGLADIGSHIYKVTNLQIGNACWGTVTITGDPCIADLTPPVAICDQDLVLTLDNPGTNAVEIFPQDVNENSYDNCTPTNQLLLALSASFNGPYFPSIELDTLGAYVVFLQVTDLSGNSNYCAIDVTVILPPQHIIEGNVFVDNNNDCNFQAGSEMGLAGWQVIATGAGSGELFTAITDANGHYSMLADPAESSFTVVLNAPFNYGGASCPNAYTASYTDPGSSQTNTIDISVQLDLNCPLMFVDLATPKIRPCFPGTYYVAYTNLSNQTITSTYVDVTLDPALQFVSSTLPQTSLGAQSYRFQTGDLDPGESGQFSINFSTDCNAPLGATHCSEAHIFPDTICPPSANWSGANIEVSALCQDDTLFFNIKNTGTGASNASLEYIVIEDVLMMKNENFQLNPGDVLSLDAIAATGATYTLQANQEPGHPFGGMPTISVEGCGGFTQGISTMYPANSSNPFIATDCRENTNSFDPNDKQAQPKGYADEHWIDPNTALDYTIRFQNTGTDTAFTVVLLDTLSDLLDVNSMLPGASSHGYRCEYDGNILKFTVDNIQLPPAIVNPEASQGFIKFTVSQTGNNPDGSVIENSAAIYFDYNPEVITNTTIHTVGTHFITSSLDFVNPNRPLLNVYPNPATSFVRFESESPEKMQFVLTNQLGSRIRSIQDIALPFTMDCSRLESGIYHFCFIDQQGKTAWSGSLIRH